MRARKFAVLAVLALIVAGCGDGEFRPAANASGSAAEARLLTYDFTAAEQLAYRFEMSLDLDMSVAGLPAGQGKMTMGLDLSGITGYTVEEGPEPGTVRLAIEQTVERVAVREFMVDGVSMAQDFDDEMAMTLAEEQGMLPEMAVVLDDSGNVLWIEMDGAPISGDLFGGDLGAGLIPGGGLGGVEGFLGPAFPDEPVGVGDRWDVATTQELPLLGPVTIEEAYHVVDVQSVAGATVHVIDGEIRMDDLKIDLAEMIRSMASDPAAAELLGMSPEELAGMAAMPADFAMTMQMSFREGSDRTWFDQAEGMVLRSDSHVVVDMVMDMDFAGERFSADATVVMDLTLERTGGGTAAA